VAVAPFELRVLTAADASAYRALRLEALRDAPDAFSSAYEESVDLPLAAFAERIVPTAGRFVLGAFADDALVGIAGFTREEGAKVRHKAAVTGMYVTPRARRHGIARALLRSIVDRARAADGLAVLRLSATAGNAAAEALYASLGFVRYGIERDALRVAGRSLDEAELALRLDAPL
jgi:hypothetical protein